MRHLITAALVLGGGTVELAGGTHTEVVSATMLTAISSGLVAPISRPMGAWIRSKDSREMPSFMISFITPMVFRLEPIMAT